VAPEELLPRAEALAAHIAQFDAVLLDYTKKSIREIANLDWSQGIDYGINMGRLIRAQTQAATQGISSFLSGQQKPGKDAGKA
jgi:enoyl-CoA hydratase/carnithine racemase